MPFLAIQLRCTWHVTSQLYQSAQEKAERAYWASRADAPPMLAKRLPNVSQNIVYQLVVEEGTGCLVELAGAAANLDRQGFVGRPSWEDLRMGTRPPPRGESEPAEWHHGWQYYASSTSEHHHRETMVLAQITATNQAHLRSHSGPGAGQVLHGPPTGPEFQLSPELFRTLVLERLRLPLHITEARCECGGHHYTLGRHSSVSQVRASSRESMPHRENTCEGVPRSIGHRENQREVERHEH